MHKLVLVAALALTACTGLIDGATDPMAMPGGPTGPSGATGPTGTTGPSGATGPTGPVTPPPPADCATPYAGTRLLRRLTGAEYDRTVGDLLQLTSDHGARFPADPVVDGFANHARALTVSPLLADQLRVAAEDLAQRAAAQLPRLVSCATMDGPPDDACADRLITELGRRAFRRPLTADEAARYRRLYATVRVAESPLAGAEAIITALLQSPHFLYRSEVGAPAGGTRYPLTAHEIATQLSYALTGSMPDPALLDAADRGELSTPAQLAAQTERLLATPRARETAVHFVRAWLETDRLATVPKDAATFPELTPEVRASMAAATDRLVEHTLFDGEGTLSALLTTDVHYVDATLARFLGVPHPADGRDAQGFAPTTDPRRRGLISDAGFLTTHARPNASSPVHRGVTVRRRMLCQPLPPPPPGVNAQPPAIDPALTGRERYAAHSASPACQGCHKRIDDIGFGLESFDGVGRWRDREAGRPIDAHGVVEWIDGADVAFDGAAELASVLADSEEVRDCFTAQWASYVWGQTAKTELSCELRAVQASLGAGAVTMDGLLVALAQSAHVRERVGPRVEVPDPMNPDPMPDPMTPDPMPDPMTPDPAADLAVEERQDSSWDTGYCRTVVVTNRGTADAEWSITTTVEGTVSQHWNAERSGDSGTITWRGVAWNSRIPPGGTASFGFCAAR